MAILSESKYGFSCQGNLLRISLLRAATAPDAEQDQGLLPFNVADCNVTLFVKRTGHHKFSWAVMPHEDHFLQSDVPMAAYLYNSPLRRDLSFFQACPNSISDCWSFYSEICSEGRSDSLVLFPISLHDRRRSECLFGNRETWRRRRL